MAFRRTLRGRIFAVLFTLTLVVMIAVAVAIMGASFSSYESEAEELLLSQTATCAHELAGMDAEEVCDALGDMPFVNTRCTLVAEDGTVLFDNVADPAGMDNHADREEIVAAKSSGQVAMMRRSRTLGTDALYAAAPVDDGMVLRLAESRASLASFLGSMYAQLVISLFVTVVLSLLAARVLTRMIVRPLREMDFSNEEDVSTNTAYEELRPLLRRINMQRKELEDKNAELERAVVQRREFTGNVSHEMKTPLQVIGGYAELMENGMASPEDIPRFAGLIREESESMRALIDDVLVLSRLDERADEAEDPVLLSHVCSCVADRLKTAAEERGVEVSLSLDDDVVVKGSEPLVEQMVYNLLDNAIKYNKTGGAARVTVSRWEDNAELVVDDEGPGVPVELRDRIFERFYRVDESRSRTEDAAGGTGLGLAIVKHTASSLGGKVVVDDSPLGGARFKVTMPLWRAE
ncbi:MAG: ATP-binding protein [Coriobacteriales bacterium]|jgi:two-component system phosphate regulon sensor histidine kinase PhoR